MNDKELANHLQQLAQRRVDADAALQHYLANKSLMVSNSWSLRNRLQRIPDIPTEEQLQRAIAYRVQRVVTKVVEDKHTKLLLVYEVEEVLVQVNNQNHDDGFTIYL